MTGRAYRKVVAVAGALLALIVLSGAAVRLTEAGLGCEDWPTCNDDSLLPEWELHGWIEFGNRLVSGVVAVAAVAAVLSAYRRRPRRPDLIRWAWGLVAGVVAQVLLGAVTVLADLHPMVVAAHFLLSMVLLWNAVVLWVRAGASSARPVPAVDSLSMGLARLGVAVATLVLMTGTVVTGTGPHGGDSRADRLPFELTDVTRVHSVLVWCLVATLVVLLVRLRGNGAASTGRWLLAAVMAQGAVGYTQFALGVPRLLVAAHIAGATAVWCLTVLFYLNLFDRRVDAGDGDQEPHRTVVPATAPERPESLPQ